MQRIKSFRVLAAVTTRSLSRGLAVPVATSLALSMAMGNVVSTTLLAPARADDRAVALGGRVLDEPRTPAIEGYSDSPVIREAHSDGGYWYWLERQAADGGIGGH